jgi:ATP-dependent helicase YprA (DUF1998 family)
MTRSLKPVELADDLLDTYRRYLGTTFPLTGRLREQLLQALGQDEVLMKGPVLEATAPFLPGRSLEGLISEGMASDGFEALAEAGVLDLARPLYRHQERAFQLVRGSEAAPGRNVIVATGTGSGKTESFLYPIIDSLLAEREAGTLGEPGVRALLLYPMNALANDQLARLRELLGPLPDITFGRYTGETKRRDADALRHFEAMFPGEPDLPNELKSRDALQANPPHILLTNYAMLEHLLLRPADTAFFDGPTARHWRFWVLDEVHTYNGAVACDVAMLLRRLKDRIVRSEPGRIRCIGTSATLGDGAKDAALVAAFASELFGEAFRPEDLVLAEREPLDEPLVPHWGAGTAKLYDALKVASYRGLEALVAVAREHGVPGDVIAAGVAGAQGDPDVGTPRSKPAAPAPAGDDPWGVTTTVAVPEPEDASRTIDLDAQRFLWRLLAGDENLTALRRALADGPQRVRRLAERLFQSGDGLSTLSSLVDLAAGARRDARALPLLPARYHVFMRALEGAFVTFDAERKGETVLQLERAKHIDVGGVRQQAFELSACRRCGHPFVAGQLRAEGQGVYFRQSDGAHDEAEHALPAERVLFRWDEGSIGEQDEDEEAAHRVENTAAFEHVPHQLCLICGCTSAHADPRGLSCGCEPNRSVSLVRVKVRAGRKEGASRRCPACCYLPGKDYEAVGPLTLGQDAPVAVLATSLFQAQPGASDPAQAALAGGGRKLIVFSDSRQDAAFFAPYVQRTYDALLQRRALMVSFERQNRALPLDLVVKELADRPDLPVFTEDERGSALKREDRAWLWLMQEFRSTQSRLSVEGVGLLAFRLEEGVVPPPPPGAMQAVARFLGVPSFQPSEFDAMLHVLVNTLRRAGACTFPERVLPDQEAFAPLDHHVWLRGQEADTKNAVLAWMPSGKRLNSRSDYLVRLARRHRPDAAEDALRAEAAGLLSNLWGFLERSSPRLFTSSSRPDGVGRVVQLNHAAWTAVRASDADGLPLRPMWRCDRCRHVTPHGLFGVCPAFRCHGSLLPVERFDDRNHYRTQYQTMQLLPVQAEEHTAQLDKQAAAETQQRFIQGRVNILSCSTTFEMGVDVGELQTVLMRNVPPETANYLQRAGRAGRRADSVALVVTYAQRRAHDLHHFLEPERMVGGRMRPPSAHIRNVELIARHVYAVAFAELFRRHAAAGGGLLPNVEHFFLKGDGTRRGPELMAAMLAERPQALQDALHRILPADAEIREAPGIGLSTWAWVDGMLAEDEGHLVVADKRIKADLDLYASLERESSDGGNHMRAYYFSRLCNTIKDRQLIGYLAGNRLLPKYGFPVHSVALEVLAEAKEAARVELTRDLRLAVGEYAPGSRIVAAGRVWRSYGLKRMPKREWPSSRYAACRCGWLELLPEGAPDPKTCGHCAAPLRAVKRYVKPEFGFVTNHLAPEEIQENRPRRGHVSKVYFTETRTAEEQAALELVPVGVPADGAGVGLSLAATRRGQLVVVNNGANGGGYNLCLSCGAHVEYKGKATTGHLKPWGAPCKGRFENVHLGHDFATDVLELRFATPDVKGTDFWLSLTYALLEGASRALEIRRDDLDGCLFYPSGGTSVILFDAVPGGAGHVRVLERHIEEVVRAAFHVVDGCTCDPEAACYQCLLSYRNQGYHDQLARGPVRDYLEHLLTACLTPSADGIYAVKAASRGRWLENAWRRAETLRIQASRLALTIDGPTPYGTPDWFDVLLDTLKRRATVKLVIDEASFPEGRDAEAAVVRNHLQLLLNRGLELYTVAAEAPRPAWPMVLFGSDVSRVVGWSSPEAFRLEGLSPLTGESGFVTSKHTAVTEAAAAEWERWLVKVGRRITPDDARFRGPQMKFRRMRPGERYVLWDVFAEFFRPDDRALTIHDPYLYLKRHFRNARLLLDGVLKVRGAASPMKVYIETGQQSDEWKQEDQRHYAELFLRDYERSDVTIEMRYGRRHDRELRITRADGTVTVVLMGNGLDFLDEHGSPKKEIYLAAFDTTAEQL